MKTDKERFADLATALENAIVDRLGELAKANGGTYTPSTQSLRDAAYSAMKEVSEAEVDPIGPMLAVALWDDCLHMNESAFRQKLDRRAKAGTLGFKVGASPRAPKSIAASYLS